MPDARASLLAVPTRRHYRQREACGTYVRLLTNSRKYQLRVWCPVPYSVDPQRGFPIHCGLFDTPQAARAALCKLTRLFGATYTPLDVWRGVARLQAEGAIPVGRAGGILPLWVRRLSDGTYAAECVRRGERFAAGPLPTAEAAHLAVWTAVCEAGAVPDGAVSRAPKPKHVTRKGSGGLAGEPTGAGRA